MNMLFAVVHESVPGNSCKIARSRMDFPLSVESGHPTDIATMAELDSGKPSDGVSSRPYCGGSL